MTALPHVSLNRPTTRRVFLGLSLMLLSIGASGNARAANEHGNAAQAIALVQKVIVSFKTVGREKTLADINNVEHGPFRDRDLYITVNDLKGKNLAHGANLRMQGKDLIDLKDADGKPFMRERMELVKNKGKGWQDYKFVNPVSKLIEPKSMYYERYDDMVINCGIYK